MSVVRRRARSAAMDAGVCTAQKLMRIHGGNRDRGGGALIYSYRTQPWPRNPEPTVKLLREIWEREICELLGSKEDGSYKWGPHVNMIGPLHDCNVGPRSSTRAARRGRECEADARGRVVSAWTCTIGPARWELKGWAGRFQPIEPRESLLPFLFFILFSFLFFSNLNFPFSF
jgi:hypothetical protein